MSEQPRHNPETHHGFWMKMEKDKIASYEEADQKEIMNMFDKLIKKVVRRKIRELSDAYGTRSEEGMEEKKIYDVDPNNMDDNTKKLLLKDLDATREELQERAIETFRLEKTAKFDDLTGLLRRDAFEHAYEQERKRLSESGIANDHTAVLFVDIDDFKRINDSVGHEGGNTVLKRIGETLNQTLRPLDAACRYGRDEITVMMKHIKKEDIKNAIARVFNELTSIHIGDSDETLSVSIGARILTPGTQEHQYVDDIVGQADTAAFNTKRNGKNGVTIIESITPQEGESPILTGSLYSLDTNNTLTPKKDKQGIKLAEEDPNDLEVVSKAIESAIERATAALRARHGGKLPQKAQKALDKFISTVLSEMKEGN